MGEKSFDPQLLIGDWQRSITGSEPTTSHMVGQVTQEGHELYAEVSGMSPEQIDNLSVEKRGRVIQETGDVIIAAYGLMETLGADFEDVFWGAFATMIEKYPPGLVQQIMTDQNLCRQDAMVEAKVLYQNGQ